MRAMVIVTENTPKGTERSPQEYANPLLVLTGEAYAQMTFDALYECICRTLRDGKPRLIAQHFTPEGQVKLLYGDGTSLDQKI